MSLFVVVNNVGATVTESSIGFFFSTPFPGFTPTRPYGAKRDRDEQEREPGNEVVFFSVCQSVTINARKPHMSFVGQTVKPNFLTGSKKQYI